MVVALEDGLWFKKSFHFFHRYGILPCWRSRPQSTGPTADEALSTPLHWPSIFSTYSQSKQSHHQGNRYLLHWSDDQDLRVHQCLWLDESWIYAVLWFTGWFMARCQSWRAVCIHWAADIHGYISVTNGWSILAFLSITKFAMATESDLKTPPFSQFLQLFMSLIHIPKVRNRVAWKRWSTCWTTWRKFAKHYSNHISKSALMREWWHQKDLQVYDNTWKTNPQSGAISSGYWPTQKPHIYVWFWCFHRCWKGAFKSWTWVWCCHDPVWNSHKPRIQNFLWQLLQ